jgi:hypothetical protein
MSVFAIAQTPLYAQISWQRCLGGSKEESGRSVQQTSDGGYIVSGWTESSDGDVGAIHGNIDAWLVKLKADGSIVWEKTYGGSGDDQALDILQTADGGYIFTGLTTSNDGDVSGHHNTVDNDVWVVKTDGSGSIQWQKCLGGQEADAALDIKQTVDGGYIIAAQTASNDGDVSGYKGGDFDIWLVKLDNTGNLDWQKCLGGSGGDYATRVNQTTDGGYILVGWTSSNDMDISGLHGINNHDAWVVKLDDTGKISWQKCLGGSRTEQGMGIAQTADGYIVLSITESTDGDVSGYKGGDFDIWLAKLDNSGNLDWQKCLGGSGIDVGTSIQICSDNNFIICGSTASNDKDVSANKGIADVWLVKVDNSGNILWQKCLGGSNGENGLYVSQTQDEGYILTGQTKSNDGDVSGNHGSSDIWVTKIPKIATSINEATQSIDAATIYPNPNNGSFIVHIPSKVQENAFITVTDILGSVIIQEKVNTNQQTAINIQQPAGMLHTRNASNNSGRSFFLPDSISMNSFINW